MITILLFILLYLVMFVITCIGLLISEIHLQDRSLDDDEKVRIIKDSVIYGLVWPIILPLGLVFLSFYGIECLGSRISEFFKYIGIVISNRYSGTMLIYFNVLEVIVRTLKYGVKKDKEM